MNKMNKFDQAKKLREQANKLEKQAENELMPALQENYSRLVGMCFKIINKDNPHDWSEYLKIIEIEHINVNSGKNETVQTICFSFCPYHPYGGFKFTEKEHHYYHILLEYGKAITPKEFDRELAKGLQKIKVKNNASYRDPD